MLKSKMFALRKPRAARADTPRDVARPMLPLAVRSPVAMPPVQRKTEHSASLATVTEASSGVFARRSAYAPEATTRGLPFPLKAGIESLSGVSMDGVKVHYNSARPAQMHALAYAQGADIHLAPGQERHLPHEAWHVVQQAQGRVPPTGGVSQVRTLANDSSSLEHEADEMGAQASMSSSSSRVKSFRSTIRQESSVIQRKYCWSPIGDDGVLIGDAGERHVIKLGGFEEGLVAILDRVAVVFGFTPTNARIVTSADADWSLVKTAAEEAGGWSKAGDSTEPTRALVMDRLPGSPLHEVGESVGSDDKVKSLCASLGRMLVMDLVLRNNDRFNLQSVMDDLLATQAEKAGEFEWRGNEGNILVDIASGIANPIDSQFTPASDEGRYAANVAKLLTSKKAALIDAAMVMISGVFNWKERTAMMARGAFETGVDAGIQKLLQM